MGFPDARPAAVEFSAGFIQEEQATQRVKGMYVYALEFGEATALQEIAASA